MLAASLPDCPSFQGAAALTPAASGREMWEGRLVGVAAESMALNNQTGRDGRSSSHPLPPPPNERVLGFFPF